jgi:hypothetical protein
MTRGLAAETGSDADRVEHARWRLISVGACLMCSTEVSRCVGADDDAWTRFASHW